MRWAGLPGRLAGALLAGLALLPAAAVAEPLDGVVRIRSEAGGGRVGSGFVVRLESGGVFVLTAAHVVEGGGNPTVAFHADPNRRFAAEVVHLEGGERRGLALLRVASAGLPAGVEALPLAPGGAPAPGAPVRVLGVPASIGSWSVIPSSVVAARGRDLFLRADADEGNSGGPVLAGAEVVGLVYEVGQFSIAVPAASLRIYLDGHGVAPGDARTASAPARPTVRPQSAPTLQVEPSSPWFTFQPRSPTPSPSSAPAAPSRAPGSVFRDRLKDGSEGPEMVVIPAGTFTMGSPDSEQGRNNAEGPQHAVRISKPFAMGKYEVSFDEYDRYCGTAPGCRPGDAGWGRGSRPVIHVSWEDAQGYAAWLSAQTGARYRLPSEAEWEYAARAGTRTSRFWGDDPDEACRHASVADRDARDKGLTFMFRIHDCRDGYPQTAPVGSFRANAFGLHDMLGNVAEWVEDCYAVSYRGAPGDGSAWKAGDCALRVMRGGSWHRVPWLVRSAFRDVGEPGDRNDSVGFRLARDL